MQNSNIDYIELSYQLNLNHALIKKNLLEKVLTNERHLYCFSLLTSQIEM